MILLKVHYHLGCKNVLGVVKVYGMQDLIVNGIEIKKLKRLLILGIHLNSQGQLTVSQREQADALGIPHEEYREYLITRLEEIRGGPPPKGEKSCKVNKVKAKRPVLVLGHGPSFWRYMKEIKEWKYDIIASDVCLDDLLKNGIVPKYVITLESSRATCPLYGYDVTKLKGKDITIYHSSITRNDVIEIFQNAGIPIKKFEFEEEPRCSNVGLFACNFAIQELESDCLVLVGFEHTGSKYTDYTYRVWQTDFWYFVKKWPPKIVVNCSNGGALYFKDYVLESTLDKLEIN